MFEMLSNISAIMKNLPALQRRAAEVRQRLGEMRVEARSEQNWVHVVVTGEMQIASISISPELAGQAGLIEALVKSTTNQALAEARDRVAKEFAAIADELGIPGLSSIAGRLGLGMG